MKKYIADLHFGHEKVIEFDGRPFQSTKEMDEELIKRWNQSVNKKDEVYILGDFAYRSEHDFSWYLSQLKGKKHLILGNHDYRILKDEKAQTYFESIHHMISVKDDNREVILFHYPMLEWKGYFRGSLHVFGHIHQSSHASYIHICQQPNMLNAGASVIDYQPASLQELIHYNIRYKQRLKEAITKKIAIDKER
ncbi:hydrolase [Clostridiales bacterium COT073_COT-073]|nr:hydrolase [Clostridiales bacterium COT073_COT-073]